MTVPDIALSPGVTIPQLGFGVFQVDPAETQAAVETALAAGYRHVDTAAVYRNEVAVGAALAATGLAAETFVTTKLWNADQGAATTRPALEASLERLGLDAVDLYLIHWPTPERDLYVESWEVMQELQREGLTRAIGVSNFRTADLQRLADGGHQVPALNQVELHPALLQPELRAYHAAHGIVTEAWSPLARGAVLQDETITTIAEHHGATPAQVVLAWHLALGHVVIPKSVTPERIVANLAATTVNLGSHEIEAVTALDRGERIGPDPADFHAL